MSPDAVALAAEDLFRSLRWPALRGAAQVGKSVVVFSADRGIWSDEFIKQFRDAVADGNPPWPPGHTFTEVLNFPGRDYAWSMGIGCPNRETAAMIAERVTWVLWRTHYAKCFPETSPERLDDVATSCLSRLATGAALRGCRFTGDPPRLVRCGRMALTLDEALWFADRRNAELVRVRIAGVPYAGMVDPRDQTADALLRVASGYRLATLLEEVGTPADEQTAPEPCYRHFEVGSMVPTRPTGERHAGTGEMIVDANLGAWLDDEEAACCGV